MTVIEKRYAPLNESNNLNLLKSNFGMSNTARPASNVEIRSTEIVKIICVVILRSPLRVLSGLNFRSQKDLNGNRQK